MIRSLGSQGAFRIHSMWILVYFEVKVSSRYSVDVPSLVVHASGGKRRKRQKGKSVCPLQPRL